MKNLNRDYYDFEQIIDGISVKFGINAKPGFSINLQDILQNMQIMKNSKGSYIIYFKTTEKYLEYIDTNCQLIWIASKDLLEANDDWSNIDWSITIALDFPDRPQFGYSCSPVVTPLKHEYHIAFIPLEGVLFEKYI